MLIMGKAVLAFGIFSVFGAAVHNHSQAGTLVVNFSAAAAQASGPTIEEAGLIIAATSNGLSRGYWSNPGTSPLQGISMPVMQSAGPIRQLNVAWHVDARRDQGFDRVQFAARLKSEDSN
jgi:hypothetical protein